MLPAEILEAPIFGVGKRSKDISCFGERRWFHQNRISWWGLKLFVGVWPQETTELFNLGPGVYRGVLTGD